MKRTNLNKGFTLVELIVVVAVLAILAVAAVIAVTNVQRNARISTATSEARGFAGALNELNESVISSHRIEGTLPADLTTGTSFFMAFNPNNSHRLSDRGVFSAMVDTGAGRSGPLDPIDRSVNFGTDNRISMAAGWVTWNGPGRVWEINEDAIRASVS